VTASCLARVFAVASLAALPVLAAAQPAAKPFLPDPGEIGKDVMWVPSEDVMVARMLDVARLTARDYLVDLGSGDGRVVIAAARRGARALGVEFNPDLVKYSAWKADQARVSGRTRFVQGDLFQADLSGASVITLFLLEENNLKLRPKLLGLKPGTRLVSNSFSMGDWQPDRRLEAGVKEGCTAYCTAYLWVVPAQVEGTWQAEGGELTLKQSFQTVSGTLRTHGRETAVAGRLRGDRIAFAAGAAQYSGRVDRDIIKGAVKADGKSSAWKATRKGA
jgi:SAM-dependent methyltransferase